MKTQKIKIILLSVLIVFGFIATFNPYQILYFVLYLDPDFRDVKRLSTKADELYKQGNSYESFLLYKDSMAKCKNSYYKEKLHIFYSMEDKFKNEEYYYQFLEEIFREQYIKGIGMRYKYSIHDPHKLLDNMMDIDTSRTKSLLYSIPENRLKNDQTLDSVYYSYMIYNTERQK
jgi:hypothetical protein